MENREEIFELLNSLLESKKYAEFMRAIDELNDIDAADYLESLPDELELSAFRMLKKDAAPSPIHQAKALAMQITGKDTPVAALPR